jgi:hypothetical protein
MNAVARGWCGQSKGFRRPAYRRSLWTGNRKRRRYLAQHRPHARAHQQGGRCALAPGSNSLWPQRERTRRAARLVARTAGSPGTAGCGPGRRRRRRTRPSPPPGTGPAEHAPPPPRRVTPAQRGGAGQSQASRPVSGQQRSAGQQVSSAPAWTWSCLPACGGRRRRRSRRR